MTSILALTLSATLSNAPAPPPAAPAALVTQAQQIIEGGAALEDAPSMTSATRAVLAPRGGDSVVNGAVIGGVVAGVASAVVLGYICHVFNETGDPICLKQVAWRSAIAAAGGALVGAGIDAMMDRQRIERPRSNRFRPGVITGPIARVRLQF